MNTKTIGGNASLDAPNEAVCTRLLARSQFLLRMAWDRPREVGPDSCLLKVVERHLARVRQYCSPLAPVDASAVDIREVFVRALRVAWFATWLARDYSIQGWSKRIDTQQKEFLRNLQSTGGMRDVAGRFWLNLHCPLFDREGYPINEQRADAPDLYRLPRGVPFLEGAQVSTPRLFRQFASQLAQAELRWAYVAAEADIAVPGDWSLENSLCESLVRKVEGQGARRNSLKNGIVLGPAHFMDLNDVVRLEGARFEDELRITSLNGPVPKLPPPSMSVAAVFCVENGTITSALSLATTKGVRRIQFDSMTIRGDIRIVDEGRAIDLHFRRSSIAGGIQAHGIMFDRCVIENGNFSSEGTFTDCIFKGLPAFNQCSFTGGLKFEFCQIGTGEVGIIEFRGSSFGPLLQIVAGTIGGGPSTTIDFTGSTISRGRFEGVRFDSKVCFRTEPAGVVEFVRGERNRLVFESDLDFRLSPNGASEWKRGQTTFSGCDFRGDADFRNVAFGDTTEFEECRFDRPPRFYDAVLHSDTSFRGTRFQWKRNVRLSAIQRIYARFARLLQSLGIRSKVLWRAREDNKYLGSVERAFASLREHATKIQAQPLAAQLHKHELEARRLRILDPGVPRSEAWMSWVYHAVADYGDSYFRPLRWLFVCWAVWFVGFFGMSGWRSENALPAASLSLTGTLKPWAALDSSIARVASDWTGPCEERATSQSLNVPIEQTEFCLAVTLAHDHELLFRFAGAIQSIASVTLIFLVLLGVRRKFQLG